MSRSLVKLIRLNGLQYNPNRDPQVYRRCVNEPFRIQAVLEGTGLGRCRISDAQGGIISEAGVDLPGTFQHEITYATPGTRIVTLTVEAGDQRVSQDLRLDVLEHEWLG
ncbi:MAG: hypothetical protein HY526_08910 [Betaproteobacteria bacterium]|nr:hypothetical protein [Betaproteobacteria bacterium]